MILVCLNYSCSLYNTMPLMLWSGRDDIGLSQLQL